MQARFHVGSWNDFIKWSTEGQSPAVPPPQSNASTHVSTASRVTGTREKRAQKAWSDTISWEDTAVERTDRLREMLSFKVKLKPFSLISVTCDLFRCWMILH